MFDICQHYSPKENELLYVGLDVGSTTVKCVVFDSAMSLCARVYRRHNARQPELVLEYLNEVERLYPNRPLRLYITGSGSRAIAPLINARYVQEVNAVTYAVEHYYPQAGSVVELGGQDAKVILWKEDEQGRKSVSAFMNDKCAGGTGATLDRIFSKVGIRMEDADRVDSNGLTIHQIAAKCGVFAETDVVGLLKAGVNQDEIIVSLCAAIARQNLEVLVRGNVLRDPVLLLGGPNTFLPVFAELWRKYIPESWEMHGWKPRTDGGLEKAIFVPSDAQYFAAAGAVLFGAKSRELGDVFHGENSGEAENVYKGSDRLEAYLSHGRAQKLKESGASREGLIASAEELEEFAAEYATPEFVSPSMSRGETVQGYIGIDGGSTSSKLVLIDSEGALVYKDYLLSGGNPIVDIRTMFGGLGRWAAEHELTIQVLGAGVTGYASSILKQAFGLDSAVVETVAHMRAATAYYGDIDVICDVGGQDIKVLFMKHGRVVDFKLNTQCSAGNGYFLQTMAEQFGIPIHEYAENAFKARQAPAFNYGCAVFMEQDRVNFQQLGWTKEEIMAGLALVLPLNIWNYVVQEPNLARFGTRFVLQGGTQKNLAAVKSQVDYIKRKVPGAEVFVHKYADIGGAIGAALEVRQNGSEKTSFIGIDRASRISFTSKNDDTTRCGFCANRCTRTFIDIELDKDRVVRHISGYGCEKGMAQDAQGVRNLVSRKKELREKYPNLVEEAAVKAFDEYPFVAFPGKRFMGMTGRKPPVPEHRKNMVVGIPRLLNLYLYAPFFTTYLRALGIGNVVFSDYTSQSLWSEGNKWGAIDPCFPAKVAPAHVHNLLKNPELTHILFPCISHLETVVENVLGNNACPIQMGTPEVVHAAFTKSRDVLAEKNVAFWKPLVNMERPAEAADMLLEYFAERLRVGKDENRWAVDQGYAAMRSYLQGLRDRASDVIAQLVAEDRIGILMIGHPYHNDPGVNHGIPEEFQMRGFPVLTIESLPVDDGFLDPLFGPGNGRHVDDIWSRNFNRNLNHKLWAAKVAARHPNLAVVDLSSFKCGFDAPTYSYIDNILDASETPHFLFHDIDQNKPSATFSIRLQTIEYFLRQEERKLRERTAKAAVA